MSLFFFSFGNLVLGFVGSILQYTGSDLNLGLGKCSYICWKAGTEPGQLLESNWLFDKDCLSLLPHRQLYGQKQRREYECYVASYLPERDCVIYQHFKNLAVLLYVCMHGSGYKAEKMGHKEGKKTQKTQASLGFGWITWRGLSMKQNKNGFMSGIKPEPHNFTRQKLNAESTILLSYF